MILINVLKVKGQKYLS